MELRKLKVVDSDIDLEDYIAFRELVKSGMSHPDWLGDFSLEDLNGLLENNSKIWMFYDNDNPVCSMMLIPSSQKDLDKFDLDLDYHEVADYGPMFVGPDYIGNHLQYQMLGYLDDYARSVGYKYAASTIHPDNVYSINNLVKAGFVQKGQREFKRGIRNIYLKDLMQKQNDKAEDFLGKKVRIVIDRKLGSTHPKHGFYYLTNYGYIPNTISGDGEELDAYLLGVFEPVDEYEGNVIAYIHRTNDDDDKLIVVPDGVEYTDEQIRAITEFQERFFESEIIRKRTK